MTLFTPTYHTEQKQKTLHIGSEYIYIQHNKERKKDLEDSIVYSC